MDYDKSGYFDEKFEELSIDDICKKLDVDIRDINDISKKTNFTVEAGVFYANEERFFILGEKNYINIPTDINIEKLIHSHPKGTSFSAEDIFVATEIGMSQIVAFNDVYFYSIIFDNPVISKNFIKNKALLVYDELYQKVLRGDIINSQLLFSINHKLWKQISSEIKGFRYEYYKIKK